MPELERKQTLLEITDAIVRAVEEYDAAEGDAKLTAMDAVERLISQDLAHKVDGIAFFDAKCAADDKVIDALIAEAEAEKRAIARRREWVRAMARGSMQRLGVSKLKGAIKTLSLTPGRVSVDITDERLIPVQFLNPPKPPSVNREAIKAALKAGEEVPGAQLVTGDEILQVR